MRGPWLQMQLPLFFTRDGLLVLWVHLHLGWPLWCFRSTTRWMPFRVRLWPGRTLRP